ncbi:hypothetical protein [Paenibacillus amylolyticus]|uniref:hypothetical protein n=1 Tax=Paenibacillus amylolyticus TaxID=1451 RepID=UPI003395DFC2
MNEPKTPNLGLNKIDRSSPSTTYFDLDKYLDQNWEKVDEGVGQVEEKAEETATQVSSIQERLDIEKRRSVTLEPGLQIINAERASAFKLEGLKGRTFVNLLGRDGNFGVASNWSEFAGTKAVANNILTVTGNGSDINPQVSNNKFISSFTPKVGDKLFLRVRATPVVGTVQQLQLYLYSATLSIVTAKNISNPLNGTTYDMFGSITITQAIVDGWDSSLGLKLAATYATVAASNRSQVQYSQAAIYKISEADKSLTDDQVADKYPYVDGLQPVKNPYAIRYGGNLLPPFNEWTYEWTPGAVPYNMNSLYEVVRSTTDVLNNGAGLFVKVPIVPGNIYTLSFEIIGDITTAYINWSWNDKADNRISWTEGSKTTITAMAPTGAVTAEVRVTGTATGTFVLKNPMFTIGTKAKPFKPREDAMLALQTELYADPITGAKADEVFESSGQYLKLKSWNKFDLNELITYRFEGSKSGFKWVSALINGYSAVDGSGILIKYNGKLIKETNYNSVTTMADNLDLTEDVLESNLFEKFCVSISRADSGWGDSYTPTIDEIKAYFLGWRMGTPEEGLDPYDGTGIKAWGKIDSDGKLVANSGTTVLPTVMSDRGYKPYQILYRLATPISEPIKYEGRLSMIEGSNQVEVGTGLVIREEIQPVMSSEGKRYLINSGVDTIITGNPLKYQAKKILSIYKNNQADEWEIIRDNLSNGDERASLVETLYDKISQYSVTYQMLDKSPIVAFVGSTADNEKAQFDNLNDIVQQNALSLSVVEGSLSEALQALIQQQQQKLKSDIWGAMK